MARNRPSKRPNFLILMGDDIGIHNISAYNHGITGWKTPNIDRIADEGALFTDCYSQQSCTAGRAAFMTGQTPFRTGQTTGSFALRSPVRPNPIASSIVDLVAIEGTTLQVRGLDCIDGTPLIDLKPERGVSGQPGSGHDAASRQRPGR